METIIKNADTFLHILEVSHSSRVSTWTAENISKAMSWAAHHQQIYKTYATREKVCNLLNVELQKLAYRNSILINLFSFYFLESCQDFLLSMLRRNTSLDRELHKTLPEPGKHLENTQILNCLININKRIVKEDGLYLPDVVDAICSTVQEAVTFTETCPVVTKAPQRAVTTLLTRVHNTDKSRDLFVKCYLHGTDIVRNSMVQWLQCYDTDIWSAAGVSDVVKCSGLSPGFCKLHVMFIVQLFERSYDYKVQNFDQITVFTQHLNSEICVPSNHSNIISSCVRTAKDHIFESDSNKDEKSGVIADRKCNLYILSEHLVTLHATKCYHVVEVLLRTLSRHHKFGVLANTYLNYLAPS